MKTIIQLLRLRSNERMQELSDIRGDIKSDSQKVKDYLYFIAEELILLNSERRESYERRYVKEY